MSCEHMLAGCQAVSLRAAPLPAQHTARRKAGLGIQLSGSKSCTKYNTVSQGVVHPHIDALLHLGACEGWAGGKAALHGGHALQGK